MAGADDHARDRPAPGLRYRPLPPPAGRALAQPVAPVFTGMALLAADRRAAYPRHQHRDHEVIVPLRGAYRCLLRGAAIALGADEVLLVAPGDWHEDRLPAGERHIGVWFTLGRTPLLRSGLPPAAQVARPPAAAVRALVARLLDEQRRSDGFSARLQEASCLELFWLLVRALPADALAPGFLAATRDQDLRRRLEALLERHHRRPPGVEALAGELGLSPRAFTAACRRLTGLSPARALATHRLGRARALLAQTALSVKEVAAHLGFADQHHFSRAYKAVFGTPPSAR